MGPTLRLAFAESAPIQYRGRYYDVAPVSFEDGLRLVEARAAVLALEEAVGPTAESSAAYLSSMRLIVNVAPRYLVPVARVRRLFWRLRIRRNPFRNATDSEVGQLLGFFLTSRTMSRVRLPAPAASGASRRTS